MSYIPSRADIINVQLDPTQGHEQKGYRPAIVLSDYSFDHSPRMNAWGVVNHPRIFAKHNFLTW